MSPAKLLKKTGLISFFLLISLNNYASFLDDQLIYSRVKLAYKEKLSLINSKLDSLDVESTNFQVMIKAYKYDQKLHVYVRKKTEDEWLLYEAYPFCTTSGNVGPKIKEGDLQIPEGYYYLNHFNPYSNFFLSLGVSYPNQADKLQWPAPRKGGAIYIHGGCASIGCIPIKDEPIKELYVLSVMAKNNGQSKIPIHIFPFYLSLQNLKIGVQAYPEYEAFWTNLYAIENLFDSTKIQADIAINKAGKYYIP